MVLGWTMAILLLLISYGRALITGLVKPFQLSYFLLPVVGEILRVFMFT